MSGPQAFIPYGAYWSSPFCRWQGSFAHVHAFELAAMTARTALRRRNIDPTTLDAGVLGTTVPQKGAFYGLPWLAGEIGAAHLAGPTIAQACATSARVIAAAAAELTQGGATAVLTITTDRVSNGPHIYYPAPSAPGGTGAHENWVLDNFERDPFAGLSMVRTAENVAEKYQIGTVEQHELVLRRFEQYADAKYDGGAFQTRFLEPVEVPAPGRRGATLTVTTDEGVQEASAERMAQLKPVIASGTVTYAGQTHPADGTAGLIVANCDKARELASDQDITVEILGFGQARAAKGMMPEAPIPASERALKAAGLTIADMAAVKSHNPFIINDIAFSRHFGTDARRIMNNYGCSLVYGHPQGPTGMRIIIELIEELVLLGGGYGLFNGCAAGDTAMALVLRVDDRRRT
jgi:acetyl-CoA acetyltransferase